MPHLTYTKDELGVIRTEDGHLLDLRAGAYDTCLILGQDPVYADSTLLPDRVVDYYAPHGDEVVQYAVLGWMRGRNFTMKDPWQKFVAPDRGRKAPRKQRASKAADTTPASEPGLPEWHPLDLLTAGHRKAASTSTSTRREPMLAGHAVAQDVDRVLLTPAVVKSLSKELRALLKEHLQHQEWQPQQTAPATYQCRYVSDVLRTLRLRSTNGLSGPWSLLAADLRRELQWHRPTLTGSTTYRLEDL